MANEKRLFDDNFKYIQFDNWCVFCGEPIPDGQLTCKTCACIVKDLTPEQQRAIKEYVRDAENRERLHAAVNDIKEKLQQALAPITERIFIFLELICDALQKEGDE